MIKQEAINLMNQWGKERKSFFFTIDFEMEKILLYESDKIPNHILFKIGRYSNVKNTLNSFAHTTIEILSPPSFEVYKSQFENAISEISYGNSFLLNLTTRTELEKNINLRSIYEVSHAPYKVCLDDQFVCFSPECFVRIENNQISSYPMKGTIDARIEDAENIILNNKKEKAEHNTIVDLIRNDLSQVSKKVRVAKYRYLQKITSTNNHLLQVSSEIIGDLDSEFHSRLGDIIFALLPAGSISGAPKPKTVEIIREIEKIKRGYYTGISGYFDGYNLDSCVMIRYIEKEDDKYFYRSGGGITSMSDLDSEYLEILQKIYVPTA